MSGKKRPSKSHVFPSLSPKNKGKNKKLKNYFYDKLRRRASATAQQADALSSTTSVPPSEASKSSGASTPTASGDPNYRDILNTERDQVSPSPSGFIPHTRNVSNSTMASENTTTSEMSTDSTSSMESNATSLADSSEVSEPTLKLNDVKPADSSLMEPSGATASPEVSSTSSPSNADSSKFPYQPPSEEPAITPSVTIETSWIAARLPNPLVTAEECVDDTHPQFCDTLSLIPPLSSPTPFHESTNTATTVDSAFNPSGNPPRGGQSPTLTFRPGRVRRKPNSKSKHVFASKSPRRAPGNMMSRNHAVAKRVARVMRDSGGEEREEVGRVAARFG